ncbi:30S ribosomal protein S2 [Treponema rectale]|uniref:Small ribosomal subunit protein uS2 n=1 Tax=Treponema rectale TaxID=744512 RepID=A0A7M1XN57_9SPIR|nr:30S ribosomal protein S2 [Treponema rectale]
MASTVHNANDPVVSAKTLLDAGVHFGHRVSRWNPKMKQFIYGKRNNLHIIDLNKTAAQMQEAYQVLKDIVSKGGKVCFVGTKAVAQKAIQEEAVRSGSFYVAHRWLGGTLTNFHTVAKRITLLKTIEQEELNGELEKLPKKEAAERLKLKAKLAANLEGIKEIRMLPQALVVVDPKEEHNAVAEAKLLNIPVFALGDTNTDPDTVDYIIPANDDGESSIRIIIGLLADAVVEGKGGEPLYAYKDAAAATSSMVEMLKGVDPNEQTKAIRAKLRNDAIAMRKKKSGGRPAKKFVKKNFRPRNNDEKKTEEAAPAAAETATEAAEPAKEN